jgi:hypothetical protein
MKEKLSKRDIHHSVKLVTELRNVIRSKGVDEFARDCRKILQDFLFVIG